MSRTPREIMEEDLKVAIKKGKARHRYMRQFYILSYPTYYFATSSPDYDKNGFFDTKNGFYQKWVFNSTNKRWILEKEISEKNITKCIDKLNNLI